MFKVIHTDNAPAATGPYSQAISIPPGHRLIFCSGQIALVASSNQFSSVGSVEGETEVVFDNIEAILKAAGATLMDVVSATVYLLNLDYFKDMNEVYTRRFGSHKPARATVQVSELPRRAQVEISVIAAVWQPTGAGDSSAA